MSHVCDRRQREHGPYSDIVFRSCRGHHVERRSPLRVTNVNQLLLSCSRESVINHSGKIVVTNFVPWEIPEFSTTNRTNVIPRINITSRVAHPYVISGICQYVTFRKKEDIRYVMVILSAVMLWVVDQITETLPRPQDDPVRGAGEQPVHEKNYGFAIGWRACRTSRNSVHL